MHSHVVNELGFDCIRKHALDIQKEGRGNLTHTPCILNLASNKVHCISGIAALIVPKLSGGEHVVSFH